MKARTVFDISSCRGLETSLNKNLEAGQNLNWGTPRLVMEFRTYQIALTVNVQKAFHKVVSQKENHDGKKCQQQNSRNFWNQVVLCDKSDKKSYISRRHNAGNPLCWRDGENLYRGQRNLPETGNQFEKMNVREWRILIGGKIIENKNRSNKLVGADRTINVTGWCKRLVHRLEWELLYKAASCSASDSHNFWLAGTFTAIFSEGETEFQKLWKNAIA